MHGKTTIKKKQMKGKAIDVQAWTGPESFGSLRLPYFEAIGT
jgi:hypothetical protein